MIRRHSIAMFPTNERLLFFITIDAKVANINSGISCSPFINLDLCQNIHNRDDFLYLRVMQNVIPAFIGRIQILKITPNTYSGKLVYLMLMKLDNIKFKVIFRVSAS